MQLTVPSEDCTVHFKGTSPLLILPGNALTSYPDPLRLTIKVTHHNDRGWSRTPPTSPPGIFCTLFLKVHDLVYGYGTESAHPGEYGFLPCSGLPHRFFSDALGPLLSCTFAGDIGYLKSVTFPVTPFWKKSSAGWLLCSAHIGTASGGVPETITLRHHHRRDRGYALTVPATHCQLYSLEKCLTFCLLKLWDRIYWKEHDFGFPFYKISLFFFKKKSLK